jgi:pimeloyl-ACP methyl ester carboxylesterase
VGQITIQLVLLFLKIALIFVPRHEYEAKVAAIKSPDEKNQGCELNGWEYRSVTSPATGTVHRYYYLPSQAPGAPTMLLFHGLNLDGRTFMHLKELAGSCSLIAYDLPESSPVYQGRFDDFMTLVNDFVDVLDKHDCVVVGVSFGGGIALRLAATHAGFHARELILISTGIVGVSEKEKKRNQSMADWVRRQPDYKLYWFMEKVFSSSTSAVERDFLHDVRTILRVKKIDFYRQVAYSMAGHDAVADARLVKCPVLLITGSKEKVFTPGQVAAIRDYIPQVEYRVVEGGTHDMVFGRGEQIAAIIRSFCMQHHSSSQP